MLSFMYAHLAFFHQGYDLFSELEPYMKDLGAQVTIILKCLNRMLEGMKTWYMHTHQVPHRFIQQKGNCSVLKANHKNTL